MEKVWTMKTWGEKRHFNYWNFLEQLCNQVRLTSPELQGKNPPAHTPMALSPPRRLLCLNWNMSAEAGLQEYFPGGQAGVSGENKGIVLHFRLHLRLTCLAELTATCSQRKTPVWSQDHPGLKLEIPKFRQVTSPQWASVSPFGGWEHYRPCGAVVGIKSTNACSIWSHGCVSSGGLGTCMHWSLWWVSPLLSTNNTQTARYGFWLQGWAWGTDNWTYHQWRYKTASL